MYEALPTHQFITKAQSRHLSNLKENIPKSTGILLLDFAENYSFIVQDAVQVLHWDNNQAILHRFALYYMVNDNLYVFNMCAYLPTSYDLTYSVRIWTLNTPDEKCDNRTDLVHFWANSTLKNG